MKRIKILALIISAIYIGSTSPLIASADSSFSETSEVPEERYEEIIEYIDNEDPATLTDDSYKEPENRVFISEEVSEDENDGNIIMPFSYGWSEKSTVKQTEYHNKITTPTGQNTGGTRFSTGGGFYVNKNGGPSVSFSVGTAWGPISYSVSVGNASTSVVSGRFINAPNTTNYFKAQINRRIRYRRVLVDRYQYGIYKNSYWTTWKDVYSENIYAVKVK